MAGKKLTKAERDKRNEEIAERWAEGKDKLVDIAREYDLSPARITQIGQSSGKQRVQIDRGEVTALAQEKMDMVTVLLADQIIGLLERMSAAATMWQYDAKAGIWASQEIDGPLPRDMQSLATALAICIDKLRLLTGEATQIIGSDGSFEPEKAKERVTEIVQAYKEAA